MEAGQDIPKEYFEAILRKACPLTNTVMEPDEIAQVCCCFSRAKHQTYSLAQALTLDLKIYMCQVPSASATPFLM